MHLLHVPGVIFLADARRPGLRRRLGFKPRNQVIGGGLRRAQRLDQAVARIAADRLLDGVEVTALCANVADAGYPEVARIAGQILLRLAHQWRNDCQVIDHPLFLFFGKRKTVGPQFQYRVMRRAFVRRNVALVGPDRLIVGRVADPWLEHAVIEIEAVHLRANDVPVHLLLDGPAADVDGIQPFEIVRQFLVCGVEAFGRVIGRTIPHWRAFEFAPFFKQLDKRIVRIRRGILGVPARSYRHGNKSDS